MYSRIPSNDFENGGLNGNPNSSTQNGMQGSRRLTFYEEARLIVPEGSTEVPINYPGNSKASLAEVRARNKVRIKT
jgi:hypothetical protein